MFGIRMNSVIECSVFEPPLYTSFSIQARILRSGRLYAVFHQNSGHRQAGVPSYEVDLISHINVSKYIVDYKLIADVEQVKLELQQETSFFLPGSEPGKY